MSESSSPSSSSGRVTISVRRSSRFLGRAVAPLGSVAADEEYSETKVTRKGGRRSEEFGRFITAPTISNEAQPRDFMDVPPEERQLGRRATAMRTLAALAVLAAAILILAAIAVKLYHHEEEVLPEVKNYIRQRMTDAKGLWTKMDMRKYKDYITSFFTCKKHVIEVIPEDSNSFLDLFKWKKIKNFKVKIADV